MIRFIAAIDDNRGLANDKGIPWSGKLPTDIARFRRKTLHGTVVMGFRTYQEFSHPLSERRNLVVVRPGTKLRWQPGFEPLEDAPAFLQAASRNNQDIWVIGGAGIFHDLLSYADQLDLTRVGGNFRCTKFFPEFETVFKRVKRGPQQSENGIPFRFEIWERKSAAGGYNSGEHATKTT